MREPILGSYQLSRALQAVVLGAVLTLSAGAWSGVLGQELPTEFTPGRAPAPKVSLRQAVELALQHDPAIRLAQETTVAQKGSLQQAAGVFDNAATLLISRDYTTSELTPNQKKSEAGNRTLFRELALQFDRVADELKAQIDQGGYAFLDCPPDAANITIGQQPICIANRTRENFLLFDQIAHGLGYDALSAALQQILINDEKNTIDALHLVAYEQRVSLRALGAMPQTDTVVTNTFALGLQSPFRTGASLGVVFGVQWNHDNYDGKASDPTFGGKAGVIDNAQSGTVFTFSTPLGKGRGKVSADAPERAAGAQLDATLDSQANTIAASALNTSLAYWNLVAAQESLDLLEHTAANDAKLMDLGEQLVKADEVAPVELAQVQARLATVRGSVVQARASVLSARVNLAKTMGLAVDRVDDAPLAAESFPALPDLEAISRLRPEELASVAVANRRDLSADRKLKLAADILAEAARVDLRRQTDLSFAAGYAQLHEGGNIGALSDAWLGAFSGWVVGPSVRLAINVNWPFQNNVAIGRLTQARAMAMSSEITAANLKRTIGGNTTRLVGSLLKAARSLAEAEQAIDYYSKSLQAEEEKFKAGESTAVDLTLTEESLTSQRLSLVTFKQTVASLLSQLRYETGTLVSCKVEEGKVVLREVRPLGLDFARQPAS